MRPDDAPGSAELIDLTAPHGPHEDVNYEDAFDETDVPSGVAPI